MEFGQSLGNAVKYCALVDYSNSRGAIDMGLVPELLPGYQPSGAKGLSVKDMLASQTLEALWVVGANPLKSAPMASKKTFVVVQDMFLTETAQRADVVLPAASAYEKNGTVTNVCGEVQRLTRAVSAIGVKTDLEIIGLIAKEMGLAQVVGPWVPDTVYNEIRKTVKGYNIPLAMLSVQAQQTAPVNGRVNVESRPELIHSAHDGLFTSGTLGRYSKVLHTVMESRESRSEQEEMAHS